MGDKADYDRCMAIHGPPTTRCAGARIIVVGYVCPHCGSASPSKECHKPKRATLSPTRKGEGEG